MTDPKVPDHLKVRDRLDNLLEGFYFWRDHKVQEMGMTTLDEMFIRWVESAEERS